MNPPPADWPEGAQLLVDTAPLICWLEGNPLAGRFARVFAGIDALRWRGIVTPVTLAEIVAGPLRHGRHGLAEQYRRLLISGPRFQLRALDADLAVFAARLRAEHRLKLPDAIQIATAVSECCDALVTHDRDFPAGAGVRSGRHHDDEAVWGRLTVRSLFDQCAGVLRRLGAEADAHRIGDVVLHLNDDRTPAEVDGRRGSAVVRDRREPDVERAQIPQRHGGEGVLSIVRFVTHRLRPAERQGRVGSDRPPVLRPQYEPGSIAASMPWPRRPSGQAKVTLQTSGPF